MKTCLRKGFSLIEVLLATTLVAGGALYLADFTTSTVGRQKKTTADAEISALLAQMRVILSSPENCEETLATIPDTGGYFNPESGFAPGNLISLQQRMPPATGAFFPKFTSNQTFDLAPIHGNGVRVLSYELSITDHLGNPSPNPGFNPWDGSFIDRDMWLIVRFHRGLAATGDKIAVRSIALTYNAGGTIGGPYSKATDFQYCQAAGSASQIATAKFVCEQTLNGIFDDVSLKCEDISVEGSIEVIPKTNP